MLVFHGKIIGIYIVRDYNGITIRSGVSLGSVWGPLGVGLGSLGGQSGVTLGVGLGSLGGQSGVIVLGRNHNQADQSKQFGLQEGGSLSVDFEKKIMKKIFWIFFSKIMFVKKRIGGRSNSVEEGGSPS